jgi:hypothetical protein
VVSQRVGGKIVIDAIGGVLENGLRWRQMRVRRDMIDVSGRFGLGVGFWHGISRRFIDGERRGLDVAVGAFGEQFDLLFGGGQNGAAMLNEEVAAFVFEKAVLKPDLAAFDVGKNLLKLGESLLEIARRGLGLFGHAEGIIEEDGIARERRDGPRDSQAVYMQPRS